MKMLPGADNVPGIFIIFDQRRNPQQIEMKDTSRTPWIDYLRGFITLLVVAHHSSLAYTTFASFDKTAYINSTHPIVDVSRWVGLDLFEDFNDIFFMSLMFLISGIFVMKGLEKGRKRYLRDRFYRLFIPFLIGVTVLMFMAYYPAYLLAYGKADIKAYLIDFFTVESWPVGPPWFIWVLFAFNIIIALIYPYLKSSITQLGIKLHLLKDNPLKILLIFYLLSWLLYVPIVLYVGSGKWTGIGPFDFQVSRVLLYFGYFFMGIVIGSAGLNNSIFTDKSVLVKKPFLWLLACLSAYVLLKAMEHPLESMISKNLIDVFKATIIYRSFWILSCSLSCIAFLICFKRFFLQPRARWQSLSASAYGIYLIHYIFVIWCQFLLLKIDLSAFTKFLITFVISVGASWTLTYIIRKNKTIASYL